MKIDGSAGVLGLGLLLLALLALLAGCDSGSGSEDVGPADDPALRRPTALRFADVAAEAGLEAANHSGRPERKDFILESIGPGAAWIDYDNDGWMDLYVPDGCAVGDYELVRPEAAEGAQAPVRLRRRAGADAAHGDRLWRNQGNGTFADVSEAAGIVESAWSFGVTAFDHDGDGWMDLFVANLGHDVLWHNNGDGTFTDVAGRLGVQGDPGTWSTGAAAGDVDGDGRLDLYVGAFADMGREIDRVRRNRGLPLDVALEKIDGRFCTWRGIPCYCGPPGTEPQHDTLLCQREDGTFEDRTVAYGLRPAEARFALTSVLFDFDGDGLIDIYVANDSTENLLWRQRRGPGGTPRFVDEAAERGVQLGGSGMTAQASMGLALADVDGDGRLDFTITNFSHDYNNLYLARRAEGDAADYYYEDRGLPLMGKDVFGDLAWGVGWHDLDNDADLDLFIANGHVYPEPDLAGRTGSEYEQLNALFECLDAGGLRFRPVGTKAQAGVEDADVRAALDAGPGMAVKRCSRQAAFADYDNDGRLDVFVGNLNARPTLLRNEAPGGAQARWIKLRLRQPGGNPDALGATVRVTVGARTLTLPVASQCSYLGTDDPRLHVGLGAAARCTVRVRWPGAERAESVYRDLAAGRLWLLDRASAEARPQALPAARAR